VGLTNPAKRGAIVRTIPVVLLGFVLLGAGLFLAGDEIKYPPYKPGLLNLGVSYGYPYSQMVGIRAEVTPKGIFGYQLGLGVILLRSDTLDANRAFRLGWSIGATAYAFGNEAKFTPFLSLIIGDVARARNGVGRQAGWQEHMLIGGAFSFGIRFRGAYLGYIFRRIFDLPRRYELADQDMPLGGIFFGWSFAF
jgi:hypothetical protein